MFSLESPQGHSAWDYAQTIVNLLHGIKDAVENARGTDPIPLRKPFNIQCDATGAGTTEFTVPRNGKWTLRHISFAGGATGVVATYVNEVSGTNLLKVNPSSAFVSDDFGDDEDVTADDVKLIISVVGQPANQIVSGNIRLLQYEAHEPHRRVLG